MERGLRQVVLARSMPDAPLEAPVLSTILIVVLVLLLIGSLPRWSHSSSWGYRPTGVLGLLLVIVLVLALTGRL